jgi:hypothetical protein
MLRLEDVWQKRRRRPILRLRVSIFLIVNRTGQSEGLAQDIVVGSVPGSDPQRPDTGPDLTKMARIRNDLQQCLSNLFIYC